MELLTIYISRIDGDGERVKRVQREEEGDKGVREMRGVGEMSSGLNKKKKKNQSAIFFVSIGNPLGMSFWPFY